MFDHVFGLGIPTVYLAVFTGIAIAISGPAPTAGVMVMTTASICFVMLTSRWVKGGAG